MNPGYPQYPQVPGQGYPAATTAYSYPSATMPQPSQPGFASSPYPTNPSYPSQNTSTPYPPQTSYPQSSYPPQQPSYPSQQPSYPSQQSSYPSQQSSYPSQQPSYPPQRPSYPSQQSPYPTQQPSYPQQSSFSQQPSFPSQQPPYSQHSSYLPQSSSYPPSQSAPVYAQNVAPSYSAPTPSYPLQPQGQGTGYPAQQHSFGAQQPFGSIVKQVHPVKQFNPTVRPAVPFDARSDAEVLRKAMKGFGTDEKAIINVLTRRSNAQRLEIALQFKSLYGKDLISDLKSELSGNFERVILSLMTPLFEFLAKELHDAICGIGTNEDTLVEILCSATNAQIYEIKNAYQRCYFKSLENELIGDTSGSFRRLLVSLCQGRRAENVAVDEQLAAKDAQALYQAGELILGTDESTFNAILATRSYPQLQRTFMDYQRISGRTFEQAIRSEFSGDIENGLSAIVKCVEDKPGFFAERLRSAMVGLGTNDNDLIRIVVSRCEIDMLDIKRAYQARYGKTLEHAIEGETSGDYKKALLSLIAG